MAEKVLKLNCGAQSYDWGKLGKDGSKVSHFAKCTPDFKYDETKPYAELWMGTHPSCPSKLTDSAEPLSEIIKKDPELYMGKKVVEKFGKDLPFLFKVLAIRKALSIQAHPDKPLAKRLFEEKPDIYKDPNHKPEMALALTPFSGFCSFRPPTEITSFLQSVPEFASLIGPSVTKSFTSSSFSSASEKESQLKSLFSVLMKADDKVVAGEVKKLVDRCEKGSVEGVNEEERKLILTLNEDFEGDVGIFCTFVLNIVRLQPGQAVFLKANEPHAYLDGDIMECMATSDNVVRAGLTPKLRDVPTLLSMLTYASSTPTATLLPSKQSPFSTSSYTKLYDPPIDEFSVLLTDLPSGQKETMKAIEGPSIVIFTKMDGGKCSMKAQGKQWKVEKEGEVFFVGEGVEVEFEAADKEVTFYRAYVELQVTILYGPNLEPEILKRECPPFGRSAASGPAFIFFYLRQHSPSSSLIFNHHARSVHHHLYHWRHPGNSDYRDKLSSEAQLWPFNHMKGPTAYDLEHQQDSHNDHRDTHQMNQFDADSHKPQSRWRVYTRKSAKGAQRQSHQRRRSSSEHSSRGSEHSRRSRDFLSHDVDGNSPEIGPDDYEHHREDHDCDRPECQHPSHHKPPRFSEKSLGRSLTQAQRERRKKRSERRMALRRSMAPEQRRGRH